MPFNSLQYEDFRPIMKLLYIFSFVSGHFGVERYWAITITARTDTVLASDFGKY